MVERKKQPVISVSRLMEPLSQADSPDSFSPQDMLRAEMIITELVAQALTPPELSGMMNNKPYHYLSDRVNELLEAHPIENPQVRTLLRIQIQAADNLLQQKPKKLNIPPENWNEEDQIPVEELTNEDLLVEHNVLAKWSTYDSFQIPIGKVSPDGTYQNRFTHRMSLVLAEIRKRNATILDSLE